MEKINFENLPSTNTPINATNLNQMQTNIEKEINTQTVTTAGTDLDDYKTEGTYYFSPDYVPENIPAGSNGFLKVMVGINTSGVIVVKQIWYRHGTANNNDYQTFVRTFTSNAWSNWKQYQMVEDSGWIDATLKDGVVANEKGGSANPQYKKIGNRVVIRGAVETAWEGLGTTKVLFTLPTEYRPQKNIYKIIACSGTRLARLLIVTGGAVSIEWVVAISDGSYSTNTHWFDIACEFEL